VLASADHVTNTNRERWHEIKPEPTEVVRPDHNDHVDLRIDQRLLGRGQSITELMGTR
jgi:hypothetical protein